VYSRLNGRSANRGTALDPAKHYKSLVRTVVGITPTLANFRIEEVAQQVIRVERIRVLRFQHACSLKFGEALQLIARESTKKIHYDVSVCGGSGAEKSTYEGRARGDNGQVKLQQDVR
jgi:hypothetical protein